MTEKQEALKPCPFCGSKNIYVHDAPELWVHCQDCGGAGGMHTSLGAAEAAWNRRPAARKLSIEELAGMDGEPVYLVRVEAEKEMLDTQNSGWFIVRCSSQSFRPSYPGSPEWDDIDKSFGYHAYTGKPERGEG